MRATIRHTRGDATRAMRALGAKDRNVGWFVHRMRGAGLEDFRIARMLGYPPEAALDSVRRTFNRWERQEDSRTEVDAQARADVGHARKRLGEAAHQLRRVVPRRASDHELLRVLLDAIDLPMDDAAAVEGFLRRLVELRDAEIRANILDLPRDVMPGKRAVSWPEVERRIASLKAQRAAAKRLEIVAGYIEDAQRRERVLAELRSHPHATEISEMLTAEPDPPVSRDALSRAWCEWFEGHRPRKRSWPDRKHIPHERDDSRLLLEQRVAGDLRIAAVGPRPGPT